MPNRCKGDMGALKGFEFLGYYRKSCERGQIHREGRTGNFGTGLLFFWTPVIITDSLYVVPAF